MSGEDCLMRERWSFEGRLVAAAEVIVSGAGEGGEGLGRGGRLG